MTSARCQVPGAGCGATGQVQGQVPCQVQGQVPCQVQGQVPCQVQGQVQGHVPGAGCDATSQVQRHVPGAPWAVLGGVLATLVFALVAAIAAQEPPRKQPARPEATAATTTRANQQRPADGQQSQHRKLFAPVDLGLLEAPDRDAWQRPDRVMDALGIADGSIVGDLGAGGGWFTIRLARRVGPNGIVYAEDVQPQMIEAIDRRVRREGWRNVHVVLGTPRNPGFPADKLDAILIVEAYHEMEDPVTLLRNAARGLKPQGRIGVIDYKKDGFGPGPPVEDRVDPAFIERDAQEAGLRVLARETFLPFQFFIILGRQ